MAIALDHFLVPTRDRVGSARLLAELLGVPWAESGIGPFSPVYVNDELTLDFDEAEGGFPMQHYCFRVSSVAFDEILGRIKSAGIAYRSLPHVLEQAGWSCLGDADGQLRPAAVEDPLP